MAVSERVARELLVESCRAQMQDRYLWIAEGQDVLDDLRERSSEALERWPDVDVEGREVVVTYLDTYRQAMTAWAAAREVVDAADRLGGGGVDEARHLIRLLDDIGGGEGEVWHDAAVRMVGSALVRQRRLVSPVAWLAEIRAEAERMISDIRRVEAEPSSSRGLDEGERSEAVSTQPPAAGGEEEQVLEVVPPPAPRPVADPAGEAPVRRRPAPQPAPKPRRERLPDIKEVARLLGDRAEEFCRVYLPAGRRQGEYWKVGGVEGHAGESMWVLLTGPKAGTWEDMATGEHGDLVHLIKANRQLPSMGAAVAEASAFLGGANVVAMAPRSGRVDTGAAGEVDDRRAKARRARAHKTWEKCRPLRSGEQSPGALYLVRRKIPVEVASSLRWSPELFTQNDAGNRVKAPALVARIETASGEFRGVQRIFLTRAGEKADLGKGGSKKGQGDLADGGVWFGNRQASRVVMTEGVEDALAAISVLPADTLENLAVVASTGGGRLHRVALPPTAREVVVLQDPGRPAEETFEKLKERREADGLQVRAIRQAKDVNDALIADRDALARLLAPLAEPGPAAALKAAPGADDVEDLVGRAVRWRAAAASGGWAAADIHAMAGDLDQARGVLAQPGGLAEGARETLEAFAGEAGRARGAMRMAAGLVGGIEDLMRQRGDILTEVTGERHPRSAERRFFADDRNHAHMDGWTERAGKALRVMANLQASERTAWGAAVLGLLAERVPDASMTTPDANARYYLISQAHRIRDILKRDDRMRSAGAGEAIGEAMKVGHGQTISRSLA